MNRMAGAVVGMVVAVVVAILVMRSGGGPGGGGLATPPSTVVAPPATQAPAPPASPDAGRPPSAPVTMIEMAKPYPEPKPPATPVWKDPVCGMAVEEGQGLTALHMGTTYHFCSAACRDKFTADPAAWLRPR